MKILIWSVFALCALLWTGSAWLLASGLQWAGEMLGSGGAVDLAAMMASWSLPTWLVVWLDLGWVQGMQLWVVEGLESLRGAWPGLGAAVGWLVPLVWIGWGLGAALLLVLAVLAHWLIGRTSRPGPGTTPVPPAPVRPA